MENSIPSMADPSKQVSSDPEDHLCSNDNHIILTPFNNYDQIVPANPVPDASNANPLPAAVKEPTADGGAPVPIVPNDTERTKRDVAAGVVKKLNPGAVSLLNI